MRRTALAAGLAAALACSVARASSLTADETSHLLHGDTVARPQQLVQGPRRYVGGVTYTMIDGTVGDVVGVLQDISTWQRFLPKTRDARQVGVLDGDPLVRVTHGSAIVQVAYALRVHRDGNVVRFWMEPSQPHDIEDAWGFFRVEALTDARTLVTYGILVDMGDGLLRNVFEARMQELALEVPDGVRDVVLERRAAAGKRASR